MDYSDISQKRLDDHIDRIIDVTLAIKPNEVTILTGGNATGKSVIRKQLALLIEKKLEGQGIDDLHGCLVRSTSMELRTKNDPEWGALSSCMNDIAWLSTSEQTINLLKGLFDFDSETKKQYIVIDELEIGMSEELQAAVCKMLNKFIKENLDKTYGILVITHSRVVVDMLEHDAFINIEGMTEDEWLHREIGDVDLDDFFKWTNSLFKAIKERSSKSKKK